jgi:hypothetical protein
MDFMIDIYGEEPCLNEANNKDISLIRIEFLATHLCKCKQPYQIGA